MSLIISFKIKEIINKEDIQIFQLSQNNNIISIIIDKENNLIIKSNKDSKLYTNIIIDKNLIYFLCIIFNKKSKNIMLYINTEKSISTKEIIFYNCYKYANKAISYPNFVDNMFINLGDKNFYGVIGDIFFINEKFEKDSIKHLFNSYEYYPYLLNRNKINFSLIDNKFCYSKKCKEAIKHFMNLKYECILRIGQNTFFTTNKLNEEGNIYKYTKIYSLKVFINEKGIEFLIFMLHDINSQIKDNTTFNFYIYKTIYF